MHRLPQHTHDELCGFLCDTLARNGWIFSIEERLETRLGVLFADVIARNPRGGSRDVLFEVKSHHESSQLGAAIRQTREYITVLGDRVHPLAFIYSDQPCTAGGSLLLHYAGVDYVRHWLAPGAGGALEDHGESDFLVRVHKLTR